MMRLLLLLALVFVFYSGLIYGSDTLYPGQSLFSNQTLVSKGGIFELGFFSPPNSTNHYLGIWYKNIPLLTVVWVLNRDFPFPNSHFKNSKLQLSSNGSLNLFYNKQVLGYQFLDYPDVVTAVILDSGNFVLSNSSGSILWQNFDFPTDTWLPTMKFRGIYTRVYSMTNGSDGVPWLQTSQLSSWKNSSDPVPGNYYLNAYEGKISLLYNLSYSYILWESGNISNFTTSYNVAIESTGIDKLEQHFIYNDPTESLLSRIVIDYLGRLTRYRWSEASQAWIVFASTADFMQRPNTIFQHNICKCLDGFIPRDSDSSSGCERRKALECGEGKTKFMKLAVAEFPAYPQYLAASNDVCSLACSTNCSCSAYAYDSGGACFLYAGDLSTMDTPSNTSVTVTAHIYIKIQATHNRKLLVVALVVSASAALILSFLCFRYIWPKLKTKDSGETNQNLLLLDLNSDGSFRNKEGEDKDRWHEFPIFSVGSIAASTNNFAITNKLGQGGFGPVYKGKLANEQFVAVKRLSKRSRQGLEEFRNEMQLIAKLQHRNLVRILGCCDEKDEMILIYEYMPNKSLDCFLFEPSQREVVLDWNKRIHIISGIAQGLLYIHQYSRLRIVHRDLKASNILLDADLNPKISDFGLARIFGGNELQANTKRIVGTYGYMSPEYAMEGLFSVKSDVFAFGVLMLEIISGKKNTGFYGSEYLCLLRYAWDLWKKGCVDELIDPTLELPESWSSVAMRYVQISLLCVEENQVDRPLISDVVAMLNNDKRAIQSPINPTLTVGRALVAQREVEICSIHDMTMSHVEAR